VIDYFELDQRLYAKLLPSETPSKVEKSRFLAELERETGRCAQKLMH
jgi:hypothetical protein